MLKVKNANNHDVVRFFGQNLPFSFKGITVLEDDTPIAMAGVYSYCGKRVVFSDLKDAARKYRKNIVRFTRQFLDSIPGELYAVQDPNEPTSAQFLQHFGFVHIKENIYRREV